MNGRHGRLLPVRADGGKTTGYVVESFIPAQTPPQC